MINLKILFSKDFFSNLSAILVLSTIVFIMVVPFLSKHYEETKDYIIYLYALSIIFITQITIIYEYFQLKNINKQKLIEKEIEKKEQEEFEIQRKKREINNDVYEKLKKELEEKISKGNYEFRNPTMEELLNMSKIDFKLFEYENELFKKQLGLK